MDPVRRDSNKSGKVLLLLAAGGIYCGFKVGYVYTRNFQVQNVVATAAKMLAEPPMASNAPSFPLFIKQKVKQLELPIEEEDFVVEQDGTDFTVSVDWETTVVFIPANPVFEEVSHVFQFHDEATATKGK